MDVYWTALTGGIVCHIGTHWIRPWHPLIHHTVHAVQAWAIRRACSHHALWHIRVARWPEKEIKGLIREHILGRGKKEETFRNKDISDHYSLPASWYNTRVAHMAHYTTRKINIRQNIVIARIYVKQKCKTKTLFLLWPWPHKLVFGILSWTLRHKTVCSMERSWL